MKKKAKEQTPTAVSEMTKQVGDTHPFSVWAEPSVWTTRMLSALETGIKGGVWFSLIDKVYNAQNLFSAANKMLQKRGTATGVDHETVESFEHNIFDRLLQLHKELVSGTYHPHAVKRIYIPKPGTQEKRALGIPTLRDRIVQGAMKHVLEPIFENIFSTHSYGFRPGRKAKQALTRVIKLLKQGNIWVVDADLKRYFDTIPHAQLMEKIRQLVSDGRVLTMLETMLKQPIDEDGKRHTPTVGTPQGSVLSPLLGNIYLNDLDHEIEQRGWLMTRYADDCAPRRRGQEPERAA